MKNGFQGLLNYQNDSSEFDKISRGQRAGFPGNFFEVNPSNRIRPSSLIKTEKGEKYSLIS